MGIPELIRDIHNRTVRKFDHCDMIACNDLGGQGIHPGDKRPVGERAARWALATVYGKALPHVGPVYREMKIVPAKSGAGKIVQLYFDRRTVALITSAVFLALNLGLSFWNVGEGPRASGTGYTIAAFLSLVVGYLLLARDVKRIEYLTFTSQPVVAHT